MKDAANIAFMDQALRAAAESLTLTSPNPRVGCVLVSVEGQILGIGHTQRAGGPHAEIVALRDAAQKGNSVQGGIAFVTMEPCSHHGRTGPCCEALAKAGIKKVIASISDPNPIVAGRGFEKLRSEGVDVSVGLGSKESRDLNIGFFSRMIRKTPWVRMKMAASLDGKTALENGVSQWITSDAARDDGHAWRARACAVLTGIGTVLHDNPRLDVRSVPTLRQPHLVVVDSRLETPLDANLFVAGRNCYIYAAVQNDKKKAALESRGATVVYLSNSEGKVDLPAMMRDLAAREINELHLEAGHRLNGAFINENLVDEFLLYLAPKLIGRGRDIADFGPLSSLSAVKALEFVSIERVGSDLRILARGLGRDLF